MRAILKYPGAKWRIAKWIIEYMPEHHTYLEPYFGSGAILFNKQRSNIETINDLDNNVVNLFKIVRERPSELARVIAATPFSRYEYDLTFVVEDSEDEIEKARRFLIQCWQGHGFRTNSYKVGWRNDVQGREKAYALSNWYRLPDWIMKSTERLKEVQIENRPAVEVIRRHKNKKVLIYADPPYLLETRTGKQYKHEMDKEDHIELLETLLKHPGPVILSGYDSNLYDDSLDGWHKENIDNLAEHGKKRKEVIWMNFKPPMEQLKISI